MKAIQIHQYGGPELLVYGDVRNPQPDCGEVLIRNRAIAVNYTDIYVRTGSFGMAHLPLIPGKEAAGEVVAIGDGVQGFNVGDRVAYVETIGAYAELTVVPEHFLVPLPPAISFQSAASMMIRGMTARFLMTRTFPLQAGHVVLIHAAAGGVGALLTQWAKAFGATVIGTVSTQTKSEVAVANGCDHVILYSQEDFVARVHDITAGLGCDVVFDSVGKATFPGSLDCLRRFGTFVSFGFASGPIPPFDIMLLAKKGSLFATWPGLTDYLANRKDVLDISRELFDDIIHGVIKIPPPHTLPLTQASEAHRFLADRHITQPLVLLP